AAGNSQKTAFTVTKSNSLTWKTNSVVVTDGAFANRGPNGADLVLANLGTEDTIFHSLEIIKLADVNVGTVGQGTVSGRTDGTTYAPITGTFMERQRLELAVTPAVGWKFTGWSGDLSGTNTRPFLFPTKDSRVTANFACVGSAGGTSTDDFSSGTLTGGTGWSGGWTTTGTVAVMSGVAQVTGTASITRTLATPLWNGTLSFDWDLDKIATSRYGLAQVYDGSWHTVWSNNLAGSDSSTAANLAATNISLSAYGSISQISFSLNGAGGDLFWIDNVRVTAPAVTNTAPLFSSDPINKSSATSSGTYTGTLAGDASDPGGKPLSFSKVSGPAWLTVAANGTFSGTPLTTDVGLNSWQVRIDNGVGGSDDAILLINVSAAPANSPPVFTVKSMNFPTAGAGISYDNTLAGSATDMNPGNLLTYSKVSGPAWLNVASGGALSGTPSTADVGTNSWTLQVSDGLGGTDTATLNIVVLSAYTVWANQNLLTQGPNGDDDGDGNTNYFEFIAGLDPKNPSSVFAVKIARVPGQSNQAAISFKPIVAGRTYTVKSSDSLASGTWTPLSGSTSSDVGNERTVTDTGATGAKKFYLIEISYP
ncbi:MAG: hypothetical protein EBY09_13535, partial [Verrucomicrobia bacterium]|nr:hypothetical protein [Verrucomicrobiota bacterium]